MAMLKPFLKWPGGKFRLTERICRKLDAGHRLVEPFAGSAAVFLNSNYAAYLIADSNPDLINLYQQLKEEGEPFIEYCRELFVPATNNKTAYYRLRQEFNDSGDRRRKSALFVYLNRHCYNGLCRYNSRGEFNSPFGRYKNPRFPAREMHHFYLKSGAAEFIHARFPETLQQVRTGDVVYCDPPYIPLSKTAYFTDYASGGFSWEDQVDLVDRAGKLSRRGIQVVISNHNTRASRQLYRDGGAVIQSFNVRRTISCQIKNRGLVGEILAVFQPAI